MVKIVEDGHYNCSIYGCRNKAKHAQNTTKGTVLLCSDCFGRLWKMSPIGMKRLKEDNYKSSICPNCGGWLSLHKDGKPCNSDVMEKFKKIKKEEK